MTRAVLNQTDSWHHMAGKESVYSETRCCVCGRTVRAPRALLRTARTNDGEWWVVDADVDLTAAEWHDFQSDLAGAFGPTILPIGPDCLKQHPEFRIGLV